MIAHVGGFLFRFTVSEREIEQNILSGKFRHIHTVFFPNFRFVGNGAGIDFPAVCRDCQNAYHRRQIRRKYSELDNIQFGEQHRYRSDSTCVLSAHQYRIGDGISTCDVDDTTQGKPYAARTFYRSMAITIEL